MAVPIYDHVVIVIEENHGFGDIIGNTSAAPYINSLANGGALLTNYFADTHPSEPNYMIIYAGSDFGIGDDNFHAEPDPSLATKVQAIGKTFVGYVESGSPEKHNPWEGFPEGTSVEKDFGSQFPTTTAGFAAMPALSFVIPNLNDDMHDGTIQQADTWLQNNIDAYAQWAKNNNSLLIITWDEDDSTGNNQVATIFYGAHIVTGQYGATQYDHFNLCATLAALVGASPPRTTAAPIDGIYSATNIAPSVPTGLQASSVTATSLTLSWTQSTGTSPITYNVLDRVGATGSFVTVASGVTSTSRTVSGLTPSTSYNFEVVATGPGGTSAPSAVLPVTTLATSVAPSVPTGLRAVSVSTTSVVLAWNASTGSSPITYSVLDRFTGTGNFVSVASGVSGTTATLTGLTPNTSYDFEVVATGPGGTSAPSTGLTVATAAPGASSIIYILEESSSSSGPWTAVQGSPFATTTDTVAGLQASTSYFFRITAQDTLLGVTSPPTVVGPVLTTGATLTESPQNTRISSPAASAVPPVGAITGTVTSGSLAVSWGIPTAIYDAGLNEWSLVSSGTSTGVQIARDGTIYQNTSNVLQEVYWNHTVYYEASTANQLSVNPGWWYLSPLSAFGTTQTSPSTPGPTPVFDDEFTSAPWLSHQQWQSGDMWELGEHTQPGGSTTGASTWWVNPIATPAGASLFSISAGQLKLGVMRNPGGLGISEPLLGTIINNQNTPGGCYRLFGYYEAQVTVPKVSGFFFGLDIENHLPGLHDQWSIEINLFIWTDGNGANVWFQIADDGNQGSGIGEAGLTLYKTNSVDISQPHRYGFDWQSDFIRCFIDGVQVGSSFPTPGGDWQTQPLATYIYTNGADYGAGDGTPSNSSLPAFALVDYYRIYNTKPSTTSSGGGGGTVSQADWIPVLGDPALTTSPQQTDVTDTVAAIIGPQAGGTTTTVPPVTGVTATVSGSTLNVSWTAPVAGTGDSSHAWQISTSGQVVHNGVADTGTTGTVELLLWGTTIYRKTSAGAWLLFNGTAWVSAPADPRTSTTLGESPDGTFVNNTTWRIVDATGAVWKLVGTSGSFQIDRTGVSVQAAANVIELLYSNHTVYQVTLTTVSSITPGSGSITDIHGNVWTIDASGNVLENGTAVPGGGSTGALSYVPQTDTIYAQDQGSGNWFFWNGSTWVGPGAAPPAVSGLNWSFWNNGVWTAASGDPRILSGSTGTGGGVTPPPPPPPSNNATFFDDFNTLNMYNIYAPAAGQTWQPAEDYSPLDQGFAAGQVWVLNPFNPATPINNIYTVSNSILSLRDDNTPSQFLRACGNQPFLQAQLKLSHFFAQTYGYFEARMAVQALKGTGAGFLLYSTQGANEIDVIQIDSGDGYQNGSFALWDSSDSTVLHNVYTYDPGLPPNFDCTQFHQYAVDVQPSTTSFYIDRVQYGSWPTPSGYNVPLYPVIYMGTADPQSLFGTITSPGSMPITAQFDYVGIWTTRPF